jgi:ATP-dependent Clp protease ATP-binding subunit ClpC
MDNNVKMYVTIYHWYRTALVRSIRLLIFSLLLFLIMFQLPQGFLSPIVQFSFNLFLMLEMFFHYKISRYTPKITIAKNNGRDLYQSFTMQALYGFINQPKTTMMIKSLLTYPQIKSFLYKTNISQKELQIIETDKSELAKRAFETASSLRGKFVTTIDVFLAYIFLTEDKTKLLFAKELKTEDVQTIGLWLRNEFSREENPKKFAARFYGGGIGEAMVSGWTPETRKYSDNFTSYALHEEPLIIGREKEFNEMLEGLLKIENNNVLLVGDIGAGKENLVRALAYHSFSADLGDGLNYKRVFELLVGPLTAGVENRGDLETRLQNIVAELSHANDVILYVPDFQNIVGGSSYNLDLSGALLPYLKSGIMPVVATMTRGAYKTYIEHNPLKEAFAVINLTEPDKYTAIHMVLSESKKIEKKYRVILSYPAIESAIELADKFLNDSSLPGSAISLLETVANVVSLSTEASFFDKTKRKIVLQSHVVKKVEETAHVTIATPKGEEKDLLLHLEDKLHERVIDQNEAITAISEAMRRVRSGMHTSDRPISFLFLGPTGVGKTETAKALASLYYGGEKNMIRLDMSEYTDETGLKRLLGSPPGEGDERGELTDKIHDNPSALVLLDEFEKAHPEIHNLFLQVFDDGRLTDNKGVTVSFSNSIIIATSNAGSEFIREEIGKGAMIDKDFHQKLLDYLQTKAIFKPELLNRFDDVITFKPLGESALNQVIKLLLKSLEKDLSEQDISLVVGDDVINKIAKEGFDPDFGARPLRRFIQDNLEDMIAQKKLNEELTRGKTATFSVDSSGNLSLSVS